LELAREAAAEAAVADRLDLRARALGLEGLCLVRRGEVEEGREIVEAGLALALEHGMTTVAAELYHRLGTVLYNTAHYPRSEEALDAAAEICRAADMPTTEFDVCLVYVMRERGEWTRAEDLARDMIATGRAAWVAEGLVGTIDGRRGRLRSARRMLDAAR